LHGLDLYRRMKQKHPSPIENCSPSEIRKLLYQLLYESKVLQLTHNEAATIDPEEMENT
jgi:hypothetical protein